MTIDHGPQTAPLEDPIGATYSVYDPQPRETPYGSRKRGLRWVALFYVWCVVTIVACLSGWWPW